MAVLYPERRPGMARRGVGHRVGVTDTPLRALVLVCALKRSPTESSSLLLGQQVLEQLEEHGATGEIVHVVDHDVKFDVGIDEGDGDAWPEIRAKMLVSDILVIATPIWLGQPSSVCKVVLERLDAELSETDDEGRMLTEGKVAVVAVVGNEEGAHHVVAEVLQALNDTGFSIAANAGTCWVGEAMQTIDHRDLDPSPENPTAASEAAARHAVHLARLLAEAPYPAR